MRFLFVHQNFPGQYKHFAPALARRGHEVRALGMRDLNLESWEGVTYRRYQPTRGSSKEIHPWVADIETKVIRAEACYRAALALKNEGFVPDAIVAHHGWGESLFLKEVWPSAHLGIYCEFYYHAEGYDMGFDPEFPGQPGPNGPRMMLRNVNNLVHFGLADAGIAPTQWQADTFPPEFRERITVVHDGIDTGRIAPREDINLNLASGAKMRKGDEIVTFVNRNIEPYRGCHIFLRALPELLRRRPLARVLIIGADGTSYGGKPPGGKTWKQIFVDEVRGQISDEDWKRVHFLGTLPYSQFLAALQVSAVHVYLTYPFVLSWSLLEAMSCGAAIVASDTPPLHEAIEHGQTGRLVNFFDVAGLVAEVRALLGDAKERQRLGEAARAFARAHYDLETVCLPRQLAWAEDLATGRLA